MRDTGLYLLVVVPVAVGVWRARMHPRPPRPEDRWMAADPEDRRSWWEAPGMPKEKVLW